MGKWTILLLEWLSQRAEIDARLVDTSPRWRAIDDLGVAKRIVGGCIQGARDLILALWKLAMFRPDVVHLASSAGLAVARDLSVLGIARVLGVRSCYHIHVGRIPTLVQGMGWEWRFLRAALGTARTVIVLDQASETVLRCAGFGQRVVRIPNGIQASALRAGNHSASDRSEFRQSSGLRRALFLGWLLPTKGVQELIAAWNQIDTTGWELVVAGPGSDSYRNELQCACADLARVSFPGALTPESAWREMQRCDLFVLPSHTEGFPYVILEAMAAGKAIVASRVGAVPEMLEDAGQACCGTVVPPRDKAALADALADLLHNEQKRARLGRCARKRVERCYDTSVVFEQYLRVWRGFAGAG